MPAAARPPRKPSVLREFLDSGAAGGVLLMAAAVLALFIANSPLAGACFAALHAPLASLDVLHWINDGLMAVFFLFVGLEIKREFLDGQLATWSNRALPCIAAAGGVVARADLRRAQPFRSRHPARMGHTRGHRHRLRPRPTRTATRSGSGRLSLRRCAGNQGMARGTSRTSAGSNRAEPG